MLPFCTEILTLNHVLKTVFPRSTSAEQRSQEVGFFIDPLFCFPRSSSSRMEKNRGGFIECRFRALASCRIVKNNYVSRGGGVSSKAEKSVRCCSVNI